MSEQIRRIKDIKDHRYADIDLDATPTDEDDVQGHLRVQPAAGEPDGPDMDPTEGLGFRRR
jgi:hypothetical protein